MLLIHDMVEYPEHDSRKLFIDKISVLDGFFVVERMHKGDDRKDYHTHLIHVTNFFVEMRICSTDFLRQHDQLWKLGGEKKI